MGAYNNPDAGLPGLEIGFDVKADIDTGICQEPNGIPFGSAVFSLKGAPNQCWQPHIDQVSSLLSAALSTSNVWTLQVSFTQAGSSGSNSGGAVLTTAVLQVTYATSAAATMSAMIAAFAADASAIAAGATMTSADTTHFVIKITPTALDPDDGHQPGAVLRRGRLGGDLHQHVLDTDGLRGRGALRTESNENARGRPTPLPASLEQFASVNIVRKGRLWVVCANAVGTKLSPISSSAAPTGAVDGRATPSGGTDLHPAVPAGRRGRTSTPSGIQPLFRTVTQTINSQVLAQLDVRGIY